MRQEGNCYVKEEGGYLRILYPQPPVCLHLPAWQEFYGFDLQGQEAWFDVDVDTEKLTFTCKKAAKKPFAFRVNWRKEILYLNRKRRDQ